VIVDLGDLETPRGRRHGGDGGAEVDVYERCLDV
jgi:hypothetical protein